MRVYSEAATERAMKVQEVILRAFAKQITWIQAAEILGRSPRQVRRMKSNYEKHSFHALFDGRIGEASPRRDALIVSEPHIPAPAAEYAALPFVELAVIVRHLFLDFS